MPIGAIRWPEAPEDAMRALLRFQLLALRELKVELPQNPNDPVLLATSWLEGSVGEAELDAARNQWWSVIDDTGAIQDFRSPRALQARLAICLLVHIRDAPEVGECLSWFLEVLGFYGTDSKKATALMNETFGLTPQGGTRSASAF